MSGGASLSAFAGVVAAQRNGDRKLAMTALVHMDADELRHVIISGAWLLDHVLQVVESEADAEDEVYTQVLQMWHLATVAYAHDL